MSTVEGPVVEGAVVEAGTIAGNVYDKYGTRNPVARRLMDGFLAAARSLAARTGVHDLHEVGCGEGHLAVQLARWGYRVRGSDVGPTIIDRARANADEAGMTGAEVTEVEGPEVEGPGAGKIEDFRVASIYQLDPEIDGAPLVVCCEVLEHLDEPARALSVLRSLARPWLLVSVPREPIWRLANLARGRYIPALGNTPGHVNHWSKRGFLRLLGHYAEVVAVRSPFPWTLALCRVDESPGPAATSPAATGAPATNPPVGSGVAEA
jgi:SAM-dependent methyltransferase